MQVAKIAALPEGSCGGFGALLDYDNRWLRHGFRGGLPGDEGLRRNRLAILGESAIVAAGARLTSLSERDAGELRCEILLLLRSRLCNQ